jgi:4a-hydroxytetrahydrobiopterin dehydratase
MSSSSKPILLTSTERSDLLPNLSKWKTNANETSLSRALKFSNFNEAWGFMSRVALRAEKLNHHPEWKNVLLLGCIKLM